MWSLVLTVALVQINHSLLIRSVNVVHVLLLAETAFYELHSAELILH